MDPITAIAAAQQSFRAVLGIARATTSAVVDHEVKAKLIEIQEGILDAQAKLGDAQAERLDLLHQVAELKEKVRTFEAVKATLDGYVLHELAPGIVSGSPNVFFFGRSERASSSPFVFF